MNEGSCIKKCGLLNLDGICGRGRSKECGIDLKTDIEPHQVDNKEQRCLRFLRKPEV